MKVAVVYHFFPHYRAAVLRELLRSTRHEYILVADETAWDPTIKPWMVEDRSRFESAPCRRLISPFLYQKGLVGLGLRRDLGAVIYLGNPYFVSTWISAVLARLAGKKVLFWTHGWTRSDCKVKAWFRRVFYKLSHGLLLYGHAAKVVGVTEGFAPDNLHVVYNSLDYELQQLVRAAATPDEIQQLKVKCFENPDRPLIVCSARLTSSCRFDLLLDAQARLRSEGHLVNVLLIGDGPERAALQAQAERQSLPVHFFGACYDEPTLARLTMGAQVTVSPGKVGLTAIQSLAYGTPVITHDALDEQGPEWEAVLPGRTGDFFRRGDAGDLARVIKIWTSDSRPTPELRAECYKVLERFYNPIFQRWAIDRAVSGQPADDLFWLKESIA